MPSVPIVPVVLLLCIPLSIAAALVGMTFAGAFSTGTALYNPGGLVVYGLPIVRVIHDLAAAATVGLLVLAAIILPGQTKRTGEIGFAQWKAVRSAVVAAALWFVSAVIVIILSGIDISGVQPSNPAFRSTFTTFLFQVELGQSLLVSAGCILLALIVAAFARRTSWVGFAAALALFALLPLALSGHAAGSFDHDNAVNSLAIHLVGVTMWTGGLFALILLRTKIKAGFAVAVGRYSTMAGWAFAIVAFSGIVNASIRLGSLADLVSPYGLLIVTKSVILVLLGVAGALQRRRVIPGLKLDPMNRSLFVRFAAAEIVFMTLAIGVAVALSKSPPPVSQAPLTGDEAREGLLGFPYPPPVSLLHMFTVWHLNWAWIALAVVLAGCYLRAVRELRNRRDSWPIFRTICWLAGCAALIWVTSGGPEVYGLVHFSSHMIQHMALMMFVPPLLVIGGPVLLALRALPSRHDGSRGIREWILVLVHSRVLAVFGRPAVAGTLFAGSLVVFYFSPIFQWAMYTHVGHVFMCVHFLTVSYLFFWVFIGVDPGPQRPPYPVLLIVMLVTLAFHAFFGVAIMVSQDVLAAPWWHALGQTNTAALLDDQHAGGGIAWGAGEVPIVLVTMLIVRNWVSSDERTARRLDRKADRDGDADLVAYNARLAALAAREEHRP